MVVEDQAEAIAFLADPASHGAVAGGVERIDTHGAVVFLVGERAYKLKRAVRFPYMDFSTLARREAACRAELAVNRRTAPALYERVAALTRRADGGLELDGGGPPVDWVVVMRRFDQDGLFDRLARRGALTSPMIEALAETIARFHATAERRSDYGGADGIARVIEGNRLGFAEAGSAAFDSASVAALDRAARTELERHRGLLDQRRRDGFVRHCHGDLHLRNICLIDGQPTLFDAIEFNDDIACIDTLFDLAFLLMDLDIHGLRAHANLAANHYLDATFDDGGLPALPLFLSSRAAIRAHTLAAAARAQPSASARDRLASEARRCLDAARAFLIAPSPRLIAIGGLSGTGKSTLARALAPGLGPPLGAIVLRSDTVRKRLAGLDPLARLPASAYTASASQQVYAELMRRGAVILAAGLPVVLDAVFARPEERDAARAVARNAGAPFDGLWLEAAASTLEPRIETRRGDASDATAAVLRQQMTYPLGAIDWRRIDAGGDAAATLAAAWRGLACAAPPPDGN